MELPKSLVVDPRVIIQTINGSCITLTPPDKAKRTETYSDYKSGDGNVSPYIATITRSYSGTFGIPTDVSSICRHDAKFFQCAFCQKFPFAK